jgi:hypothetical protein
MRGVCAQVLYLIYSGEPDHKDCKFTDDEVKEVRLTSVSSLSPTRG